MTFGLTREQIKEAGAILQEIAQDWRGLIAGSEGFLTEENRRGLFRQEVVWGEMVLCPFIEYGRIHGSTTANTDNWGGQ